MNNTNQVTREQFPINTIVSFYTNLEYSNPINKEILNPEINVRNYPVWGIIRKYEKEDYYVIQDQFNNFRLHYLGDVPSGKLFQLGYNARLIPSIMTTKEFFDKLEHSSELRIK